MNAPTCGDIRELLSAYLDGDLEARTAGDVRSHLESCPGCRTELELLRLTVGALRSLPELPAPAGILAGVRARLRPEPWHRRLLGGRQWLLGVPVGAVATLLVVVGVALFQARYPGIEQAPPPTVQENRGATPPVSPAATPAAPKEAPAPLSAGKAVQRPADVPKIRAAAPQGRSDSVTDTGPEARLPPVPTATPGAEGVPVEAAPPVERDLRQEEATAPPRFVVPEPEPLPEGTVDAYPGGRPDTVHGPPHRRSAALGALEGQPSAVSSLRGRESVAPAASAPGAEAVGAPRRVLPVPRQTLGVRSAGGDFETVGAPPALSKSAVPGTIELGPPGGASLPAPGVPAPVVEAWRSPVATPHLRVVCLLPPDGGTIGEFSGFLKREGAMEVWIRALEPREVRDAFAPHRERLAFPPEPTRGWLVTARIPQRRIERLREALTSRPGLRLLEEPAGRPGAGDPAEVLDVRITVLR